MASAGRRGKCSLARHAPLRQVAFELGQQLRPTGIAHECSVEGVAGEFNEHPVVQAEPVLDGLEVRSDVGARLSRIETQEVVNQEFELALREILSDVEDLDVAEAISRLNLQLVALQAAQQTFVNTQGLNLFDYL